MEKTYGVSADGCDDGFADLCEVRPAFEEAVLVDFGVYGGGVSTR